VIDRWAHRFGEDSITVEAAIFIQTFENHEIRRKRSASNAIRLDLVDDRWREGVYFFQITGPPMICNEF
jgi:hypothetical protein